MGIDISPDEAQRRLKGFTTRTGWESLPAVQNGRIFGIYHTASRSLSDLAAAQFMAKTLYPDAFADVNPEQTYKIFHEQYLPIKPNGTFFIQLGCGQTLCLDDKAQSTPSASDTTKAGSPSTEEKQENLSLLTRFLNWLSRLFS